MESVTQGQPKPTGGDTLKKGADDIKRQAAIINGNPNVIAAKDKFLSMFRSKKKPETLTPHQGGKRRRKSRRKKRTKRRRKSRRKKRRTKRRRKSRRKRRR